MYEPSKLDVDGRTIRSTDCPDSAAGVFDLKVSWQTQDSASGGYFTGCDRLYQNLVVVFHRPFSMTD